MFKRKIEHKSVIIGRIRFLYLTLQMIYKCKNLGHGLVKFRRNKLSYIHVGIKHTRKGLVLVTT